MRFSIAYQDEYCSSSHWKFLLPRWLCHSVVNMRAITIISCVTTLAKAAAVNFQEAPLLVVKIEQVGNSEVKASITNTGNEALRVLRAGSILDSSPIEKVKVFQGSMCAH
jgi:hypothetical protein